MTATLGPKSADPRALRGVTKTGGEAVNLPARPRVAPGLDAAFALARPCHRARSALPLRWL
ncbi:MAG: hypothetical protein AB7W59_17315, partial [Acidimicrobiia bacterium]